VNIPATVARPIPVRVAPTVLPLATVDMGTNSERAACWSRRPIFMTYTHFKNSKDGMHCVQACLQMMLAHFGMPVLSFKELDEITGHVPGKFTWIGRAMLWIESIGFEVVNIENLDYTKFARDGESYLSKIWPREMFEEQKKFSDLKQEQDTAQKIISSSNIRNVYSDYIFVTTLESFYLRKFFVMLSINPYALRGENGYGSHLVVVHGFDNDNVYLLDPDASGDGVVKVSKQSLESFINAPTKPDVNAVMIRPILKDTR
jgi:hypothetical protein